MTHMKPSQAAREAARPLLDMMAGYYVGVPELHPIVQAFARFEAETRKDERERCAALANNRMRRAQTAAQSSLDFRDEHLAEMDAARSIEKAIRNQEEI